MVFPSALMPGIVTYRFEATWNFYTEVLGFTTAQHLRGFVRLQHPCGATLLVTAAEQGDTPPELVSGVVPAGWWLSIEVGDVQAEKDRLRLLEVSLAELPEPLRWHPRAIALRDPNGVLLVIAERASRVRSFVVELAGTSSSTAPHTAHG